MKCNNKLLPCKSCGKIRQVNHTKEKSVKYTGLCKQCRGKIARGPLSNNWKGGIAKRSCGWCGIEFIPIRENRNRKYCSEECEARKREKLLMDRWDNFRAQRPEKNTYKTVSYKRFPKDKWCILEKMARKSGGIDEHRAIFAIHLDRPLDTDEEVHHMDGNKRNNTIDNLALVSKKEHNLVSKILKLADESLAGTIVKTLISRYPALSP